MIRKCETWLVPILIFFLMTPFSSAIDQAFSGFFYTPETGFSETRYYHFVYSYFILPGWVLAIGAFIGLIFSWFHRSKWRKGSLFILLTFALGAGVISNVLLKEYWGRPRPRQTIAFGGIQEFRPFYLPNFFNQPEPSKSFPCGHCTMGFLFLALGLLGNRMKNKTMQWGGYLLAAFLGLNLSLARIAMGGHFLTDVFASALIMWLTALVIDWICFEEKG